LHLAPALRAAPVLYACQKQAVLRVLIMGVPQVLMIVALQMSTSSVPAEGRPNRY
jgi:hypothetical protein